MSNQKPQYQVILPEGVPRGLEAAYANEAVRQAEARGKAEEAQREERRLRQQQQQETLKMINAERIEREAKEETAKREREAKRFEDVLREQFLTRNAGATDNDWSRNRRSVIDEAMRQRALGRDPVADLVAKKRASGLYGPL